jgi:hypothetical protein
MSLCQFFFHNQPRHRYAHNCCCSGACLRLEQSPVTDTLAKRSFGHFFRKRIEITPFCPTFSKALFSLESLDSLSLSLSLHSSIQKPFKRPIEPMPTYLITGSSRSLGLGYTRSLLSTSPQVRIVAAVRDPSNAKDPLDQIKKEFGNDRIHVLKCDVTDEKSTQVSAKTVLPSYSSIRADQNHHFD